MSDNETTLKPKQSVRRFEVFAEFTRQERIEKGDAPDVAKGEGIWRAKVVAAKARREKVDDGRSESKTDYPESKWKSLNGEEQTDRMFDEEIIDRMGEVFYNEVFVPTIQLARKRGEKYMDVRDSIREDWQLPKSKR
jgi:hypothetical protein